MTARNFRCLITITVLFHLKVDLGRDWEEERGVPGVGVRAVWTCVLYRPACCTDLRVVQTYVLY